MSFYYRVRRTATVISAGSSWLATFDGEAASYTPTVGGEIHVNGAARSVCADIGLELANQGTFTIYTEAGVGSEVQIHYNGVYTELAANGTATFSIEPGITHFAVIAKSGSIVFEAFMFGVNSTIMPISLYAQGADPVLGGVTPGSGVAPGTPIVDGL